MAIKPRLETKRTVLRPLDQADIAQTHALWTDPGVRKYLWDDRVIDDERAAEVVVASEDHFTRHGYGLWAVCDKNSGDLMGVCGFRPSEAGEPELLLGFWPRYWGQGFANEAAQAAIAYLFDVLEVSHVVAATDVPNEASIKALQRLGMQLERHGMLNGLDTYFYRLARGTSSGPNPS